MRKITMVEEYNVFCVRSQMCLLYYYEKAPGLCAITNLRPAKSELRASEKTGFLEGFENLLKIWKGLPMQGSNEAKPKAKLGCAR